MDGIQPQTVDFGTLPGDLMKSYRQERERELGFVARSRQMKHIKSLLSDYSADRRSVTVIGPAGTGRKTVAKAIHLSSSDWWRPFIEADLTGIDDKNAHKFLFGYEEGHIFSSSEVKPGLVSLAAGSTLCLKNFDRYSKDVHKALHDAYISRQFKRFSGNETLPLECRLIFTVHNPPAELEKVGHIEEVVSKMLSGRAVNLAPLSKRKDDIVPLAEKFIRDCCSQFGLPLKKLTKEAEKWLKKAPWNKNVNQLKKTLYCACFNTSDNLLYPSHFALAHDGNIDDFQEKQLDELSIQSLIEMKLESFLGRLGQFEATHLHEAIMDRVEEPLIRLVLSYAKGNQIRASRMLGINRNTLRAKLTKYNIKVERSGKIV